ncbi:MAG: hypothetical protein QM523_03395 [Candidatus Pacebacteria bacterium]|nr:hypothetical protein [Candidatus Paceibacterota bacterium]
MNINPPPNPPKTSPAASVKKSQGRGIAKPLPPRFSHSSRWNRLVSHMGLIPFGARSGPSFMVWIIGGMVFLAVLFAAATMMIAGSIGRWQADLAGSATVQLMPNIELAANQQRELIDRQIAEMVTMLKQTKGVKGVEVISPSRNKELLAPFLGTVDLSELPMPRLIGLTLEPQLIKSETLRQLVIRTNPLARYESHLDWLSGLVHLAYGLQILGITVLILVFAIAMAAVMIVTRSNLNIHLDIIEVMHFMGAEEKFIARSFVWHSLTLSLIGAAIGGGLACLTIRLLGLIGIGGGRQLAEGFATDIGSSLHLGWLAWMVLLGLMILMVILCTITAWRTSITAIRRLP